MAGGLRILKVLALFASMAACARAQGVDTADKDLQLAMAEMKAGSYYGFAMLLQIVHTNNTGGVPLKDATFLMPGDQDLANAMLLHYMGIGFLQKFLARHSIPQALKFNNLLHFPTGTLIPTNRPDRMVRVSNHGRSNFVLNDSRIVSPNVCRATASIRCHGISAVIDDMKSGIQSPSAAPAPSIVPEVPPPPAPSDSAPVNSPSPASLPGSNPSPSDSPAPSMNMNGTGSKGAAANHRTSILLFFAAGIAYFLQA